MSYRLLFRKRMPVGSAISLSLMKTVSAPVELDKCNFILVSVPTIYIGTLS